MDVKVGDKLIMKKNHPCGSNEFEVLRIGMDFRIRCTNCGREVMVPRAKIERSIKNIARENEGQLKLTAYIKIFTHGGNYAR